MSKLTVVELKEMAKKLGLVGFSKLKKAELIALIEEASKQVEEVKEENKTIVENEVTEEEAKTTAKEKKEKPNVYEMVTNRIIEELEKGVIPWRKPWSASGVPVNWLTQKPYRGINSMLLPPGEYATFKQITDAKGKLKKGAQSQIVVFWKWLEKEDEATGEVGKIPFLRYYRVFNIKDATGIESKRQQQTFEHDPIEEAEKIIENYIYKPTYDYNGSEAYYLPFQDHIVMPNMKDFKNIHEYYSVLFHESIHSTGHRDRLNRPGVNMEKNVAFGSETYSKEELVAEVGAHMLCTIAGIDSHTIENSASYIASWLRALKDDKKLIVTASAQAQKACDYMLNVKYKD